MRYRSNRAFRSEVLKEYLTPSTLFLVLGFLITTGCERESQKNSPRPGLGLPKEEQENVPNNSSGGVNRNNTNKGKDTLDPVTKELLVAKQWIRAGGSQRCLSALKIDDDLNTLTHTVTCLKEKTLEAQVHSTQHLIDVISPLPSEKGILLHLSLKADSQCPDKTSTRFLSVVPSDSGTWMFQGSQYTRSADPQVLLKHARSTKLKCL